MSLGNVSWLEGDQWLCPFKKKNFNKVSIRVSYPLEHLQQGYLK